jgi:hypothetical protein
MSRVTFCKWGQITVSLEGPRKANNIFSREQIWGPIVRFMCNLGEPGKGRDPC